MKKILTKILTIFLIMILSISVSFFLSSHMYKTKNKKITLKEINTISEKLSADLNDFNTLKVQVMNDIYPVGSIYISTSLSTVSDVQNELGGTWEVYADGEVLKGTSSNAEDEGGDEEVAVEVENLPSHTHTIAHTHTTSAVNITSSGAHTHTTTAKAHAVNGTTNNKLTAGSAGAHGHTLPMKTCQAEAAAAGVKCGLTNSSAGFGNRVLVSQANYTTKLSVDSAGAHTHSVTGTITIPNLAIASSGAHTHGVSITTNSMSTSTSGKAGKETPDKVNVEDPYITVYMYKRVS